MTDTQPAPPASPAEAQPAPATAWPAAAPIVVERSAARPPTVAWLVTLALAAVLGALLFAAGYLAHGGAGTGTCAAPSEQFAAFCDAYDKLKQQYVDNLDDAKLAEGAIQGMFQYGVQDPFSGYMPPQEYQQALGNLSGKFEGIGAEMAVKNLDDPADLQACDSFTDSCVLVVVAPISGSPAEKAGLQAGDVVRAIDGASVNGSTMQQAVGKVRGKAGTDVTLSIERDGRTFDVTITRAEIQMREVTTRMIDKHIGLIALHSFSESSAQQFHDALAKLIDDGADQIIFDLRDNPGGYIDAARRIASEFVDHGLIFTQESSGDQVKRWEATGGGAATNPDLPVVVLVNNGSASASEIVSAALKELGRAEVIGQHTFGKNTVQVWAPLENKGGVRITISRWFTPDHNSVHPDGVQPDVTVEVPEGTPPEKDLYVDAAVRYLGQRGVGEQQDASPSSSPAAALPLGALPFATISYDAGGMTSAAG